MIRIKDYYRTAYKASKQVVDAVYFDRPKAVKDKVDSYIVIDIPSYVSNREQNPDGNYDFYVTTVEFYLFVRDKVTPSRLETLNIEKIDEISQKMLALFPISNRDLNVKIHRQRFVLSGSDGEGWHYALISARLTTYF